MSDLRPAIHSALQALSSAPLRDAAKSLLKTLGYQSDRTLNLEGSKPQAFLDLIASQGGQTKFDETKALFGDWKSADILFQLSDTDISGQGSLFKDTKIQPSLLQSYLFFAIELKGKDYARGRLTAIARQINRFFPMPVMLLIRHGDASGAPVLSIAVINRRRNKLHAEKDVLEKVTLIRDISLTEPHRGHLDILASFSVENLVHPKKLPIDDFDTLHAAWEQIFNVELLNNRFYKELSNWYFWALPQVEFPADLEADDEKRRATGLIRLLTRLVFCWFLKEKGLIPEKLFHPADLAKMLKGFDPESETSSTYYQAILQNLFFATLNQRMGKDAKGQPYRVFAKDEGFAKNRATYDVNNLYRYEALFRDEPDAALAHFADIPFLNGGLFECLDRTEDGTYKKRYLDGFSRNAKKRPLVPDRLFFDEGETADLSEVYGDKKRKSERVTGLITILNRYKFTIVENTPIDQEIALDPELLGKVFENLLASYNEETKTTARKQTGSFYTPRPIVEYMVDESLKAHLTRCLVENAGMTEADAKAGLDLLFAYTEKEHPFSISEVAVLIAAIDALKILDPACGSGAFPMGVLHKLVYLLSKLDPENVEWEKLQLAKVQEISDTEERRRKLAEIASNFADNNDDYGRKLYLIENCLYGVDIQPIAIQITKLRFFISLVCDQKTNRSKKDNHGIRPLPNLETKFVAANTLIGLPEMDQMELVDPRVYKIEAEIESLYHNHFSIQRRDQKLAVQGKVKSFRKEMAQLLAQSLMSRKKSEHIAEWDPFDPQSSADFFDPHWMFGRSLADGFDIVIGNPPYVFARDSAAKGITQAAKDYYYANYSLAEYQVNLYPIFIEAGSRALNKHGILCFITPNNWLTINTNRKLRQFVLAQSNVSILNFYARVFESADVDAAILLFQTGTLHSKAETVQLLEWTTGPELIVDAPKGQFLSQADAIINIEALKSGETGGLIVKIEKNTRPLNSLAEVKSGLKAYEIGKGTPPQTREMKDGRVYHSTFPKSGYYSYLDGRDVCRYFLGWSGEYLKYGPNLGAPRGNFDLFSTPRILVRQIPSKPPYCINACFTSETLLNDLNSMNVINITIKPQLVLAVLNSRLMTYWFVHKFGKMQRGIFPQFKVNELAIFPIPNSFSPHETSLSAAVDRVLATKRTNPAADTSALEREIDHQVYALYGLTPNEIAIVEGTAK